MVDGADILNKIAEAQTHWEKLSQTYVVFDAAVRQLTQGIQALARSSVSPALVGSLMQDSIRTVLSLAHSSPAWLRVREADIAAAIANFTAWAEKLCEPHRHRPRTTSP